MGLERLAGSVIGGICELDTIGFIVAVIAAVLLTGVAEGAAGRSRAH